MQKFYDVNGNEVAVFDSNQVNVTEMLKAGAAMVAAQHDEEQDLFWAIVPEGYTLKIIDRTEDNEEHEDRKKIRELGRPLRNTGTVRVADVPSFIYMVKREGIPDTTIIEADLGRESFTAVINAAKDGETAGFADRKIYLKLVKTLAYVRWDSSNKTRMTPLQMADFIEENLENIIDPPAAEMIEMVSNLKIKRKATFHSVIDINTGMQSVSFSEDVKGEVQNGSLEFRGKFRIAIAPFQGCKKYEIDCSLRFSINEEEALTIFYSMINSAGVLEHAFAGEKQTIVDALGVLGLPIISVT